MDTTYIYYIYIEKPLAVHGQEVEELEEINYFLNFINDKTKLKLLCEHLEKTNAALDFWCDVCMFTKRDARVSINL